MHAEYLQYLLSACISLSLFLLTSFSSFTLGRIQKEISNASRTALELLTMKQGPNREN